MNIKSLSMIAVAAAVLSNAAFADQLCGIVKIELPHGFSASMPSYTLSVANDFIPEPGFSTTYSLMDDNAPVLKKLVNGKFHCVEGEYATGNGGGLAFIVEKILK